MSNKRLLEQLTAVLDITRARLRSPTTVPDSPFARLLRQLFDELNMIHMCIASRQDDPDIHPIYSRTSEFLTYLSRHISGLTSQNAIAAMDEFSQKFQSYCAFIAHRPRT